MTAWQRCFRLGFVPQLSERALEALAVALLTDDPRRIIGATTSPPPLQVVADWPVEGACPLSFALWQGDQLGTVGQVEEAFASLCYGADQRLGEPAACRYLLNWIDETPRQEMRQALLVEVLLALIGRMPGAA
jgi:hypothetical protein